MAWIDIKLEDVDTSDLISELEDRYLDKRELMYLVDIITNNEKGCSDISAIKIIFLISIADKYSLKELHEIFDEKFETPISENQLSLPI